MPYLSDLQAVIGRMTGLPGFEDYAERAAQLSIETMLQHIILEQPYGHVEKIYKDTVSNRIHHTPISDGWRPSVDTFSGNARAGATVRFENVSEHIRWVMEGAPEHTIPFGGDGPNRLLFWWGEPHRWPPKDGDPPGERIFKNVQHPGIPEGNRFMDRAAGAAEPEISEVVKANVSNYIRDFMIQNGLKEVNK